MSEIKENGEIIAIKEIQPIGSEYQKLVFVIKNNTGYEGREKILAFEIFEGTDGDKIEKFLKYNKIGKTVDVDFEIRCNENKGNLYTSLSAWKVFGSGDSDKGPVSPPQTNDALLEEPPF